MDLFDWHNHSFPFYHCYAVEPLARVCGIVTSALYNFEGGVAIREKIHSVPAGEYEAPRVCVCLQEGYIFKYKRTVEASQSAKTVCMHAFTHEGAG